MDNPPRKMAGKLVSGACRLSTISEKEPEKPDTDPTPRDPLGGSEWAGSSFSVGSDKLKSSSSDFSSDDSCQTGGGGIVQLLKLMKLRIPGFVALLTRKWLILTTSTSFSLVLFYLLTTRCVCSTSSRLPALSLSRIHGSAVGCV